MVKVSCLPKFVVQYNHNQNLCRNVYRNQHVDSAIHVEGPRGAKLAWRKRTNLKDSHSLILRLILKLW